MNPSPLHLIPILGVRSKRLVFSTDRSRSWRKCGRHCEFQLYFTVVLKSYAICLYFYTSKSQGVISSKMKTHFSSIVSSNISKNRIYYRQRLVWEIFFKFFLKSWPIDLKGKVLLEKWNFLLALNQQQLKRRPTKTWKSSCRVLLVEIKNSFDLSAEENRQSFELFLPNWLHFGKYVFQLKLISARAVSDVLQGQPKAHQNSDSRKQVRWLKFIQRLPEIQCVLEMKWVCKH